MRQDTASIDRVNKKPTTISTFPPEILAVIFIMLVESNRDYDYRMTSWMDRVTPSSVCRQWRKTALAYPGFWSSIPLHPEQGVAEMIARSKDHPLSIRLDLSSQHEHWKAISHHHTSLLAAEKLGEFHLQNHKDRFSPHWDLLPKTEAPALQSLNIAMPPNGAHLPSHVLSALKPVLQHLTLVSCEINWKEVWPLTGSNDLGIRNLRTLSLCFLRPRPPKEILEGILLSSANLQDLRLKMVFEEGFDPKRVWPNPSDVPPMYVKDDLGSCVETAAFLSRIPQSIRTSPDITISPGVVQPQSIAPQTPAVIGRDSSGRAAIARIIFRIHEDSESTDVQLRHGHDHPSTADTYKIRYHFLHAGPFRQAIRTLFPASESITQLRLAWIRSGNVGLPAADVWQDFVGKLGNLEKMEIMTSYDILRALVFPPPPTTTTTTTTAQNTTPTPNLAKPASSFLPWPALRCLRFWNCVLPDSQTFRSHIQDILTARIRGGLPIPMRIELGECHDVSEEHVRILRDVDGLEIVWDGPSYSQ